MMKEKKRKTDYTIKSLVRALRVLEEFVKGEEKELGISELAMRTEFEKNNVFRILATLQLYGYVEQNKETENYRLSSKCLLLGDAFLRKIDLLKEKQKAIETIAKKTGECVYFCMKNNNNIYHLLSAPSSEIISVNIEKWRQFPANIHVAGKLIEKLERTKDKEIDFEPMIDRGESIKGVISIAFPVVEINHISAIVVYIPSFRGDEERVKSIINVGMEIVPELNKRLGEKRLE